MRFNRLFRVLRVRNIKHSQVYKRRNKDLRQDESLTIKLRKNGMKRYFLSSKKVLRSMRLVLQRQELWNIRGLISFLSRLSLAFLNLEVRIISENFWQLFMEFLGFKSRKKQIMSCILIQKSRSIG